MESQAKAEPHHSATRTPLTDAARFTVTKPDVGSEAVRAGIAADLERDRNMLLAATKFARRQMRPGSVEEYILEQAIRVAELPK